MNFIESLNWRYATKRMSGEKVPAPKIENILEAIRLSASSLGLQPYKVLVVENQELKEKIFEEACRQPQIKESSHVLVFAAWRNAGDAEVDEYINRVASTRGIDREKLTDFEIMIRNAINRNTPEQNANWFAKQTYIGLGFGLTAAAVEKVDSTPMEGFNADAMDKVLGLEGTNLHTTCVLTLGYRDEKTDYLVHAKKVRRSKSDLFVYK